MQFDGRLLIRFSPSRTREVAVTLLRECQRAALLSRRHASTTCSMNFAARTLLPVDDALLDVAVEAFDFLNAEYRSQTVTCNPGDLLVIATDGVLEAENGDGEEFGAARLEALVRAERRSDLPALAAKILESVKRFGKQTDDQTLLLMRRTAV